MTEFLFTLCMQYLSCDSSVPTVRYSMIIHVLLQVFLKLFFIPTLIVESVTNKCAAEDLQDFATGLVPVLYPCLF